MCDKVQIPPCAVSAPTQEDHEKRSQDRSTYYTTTEFDVYEAFVAIQTTGWKSQSEFDESLVLFCDFRTLSKETRKNRLTFFFFEICNMNKYSDRHQNI